MSRSRRSSVRVMRRGLTSLEPGLELPLLGPALCEDRFDSRLSRSLMFFLIDCWVFDCCDC